MVRRNKSVTKSAGSAGATKRKLAKLDELGSFTEIEWAIPAPLFQRKFVLKAPQGQLQDLH